MKPVQLFQHWAQVRTGLIETIQKFSEEELGYQPFPGAWCVGQIAVHIAECEEYWLQGVVLGKSLPDALYPYKQYPRKADVINLLSETHARTSVLLDSLEETDLARPVTAEGTTVEWVVWHVLEHEIHHRGEMSLIHGLLGREGLDV